MKKFITHMLQGVLIGGANIIPGLSGSTLALILGIYEKIITILTKFDLKAIQLAKEGQFRNLKTHISFNFPKSPAIPNTPSVITSIPPPLFSVRVSALCNCFLRPFILLC